MAAAPAASAPPDTTPAAPTPAVAATLASKIIKQGKPAAHVPSSTPVLGKPGKHRVVHGSVTLGYDAGSGERIVAHAGAVIDLTAEEAGPLVASETVKRLEEQ